MSILVDVPLKSSFNYDLKLNAFVIKRCHKSHYHQISAHIAKYYPSNRHLDASKSQEVLTLLDVRGNTTLVHNYFERKRRKRL